MSSIVRRVKSFSVRKSPSADELPRSQLARPKRRLVKEKSMSMENVPLRVELEKSDLFRRQKEKAIKDEERDEEVRRETFNRGKLRKRKSVSFDEARFSRCIEEFETRMKLKDVDEGGERMMMRGRYRTVDVIKDLITDCEAETKSSTDNVSRPGNFPVVEEEDVQLRPRNVKQERPKTFASSVTKKKEDPFDFRGVTRMEIGEDVCIKIRPRETLRLDDGYLRLLDDRGATKATIRNNVTLRKGAKVIGKTEIEMIDQARTIYRLHFGSSREQRLFVDFLRSYHNVATPPVFPKTGPWFQLRKLLKKRSSRDILESKGIIKNEPIFGNTLEELCDAEHPVPEVITKITKLIEEPQNITSVGLYRASANLAIVQNIRCEINAGRWDILEKHRYDVDVLAGTVKLFFRELKEPLISYEVYQRLHNAIMNATGPPDEISQIVSTLPQPNRSTLLHVIKHLLRVCRHKEQNKMDLHNISICWGPSLITLPDTCVDLVTQTTQFTKITEELLVYYSTVLVDDAEEAERPPDFVYEVVRSLTEIVERGIEVEGIYRKSGSNAKIDKIMKLLERRNLTEVENGKFDIHDVCCALKKFIANFRKEIVPDQFFLRYLEICDNVDVGQSGVSAEVRRMAAELPRKEVIHRLFGHLQKVVLHERKNKMSLGVVTEIWMATLMAGGNIQNYKKKMARYSNLFLILMNLNEQVLPDLVAEPKMRHWSKYDNVPDDIPSHSETFSEKTKL